MSEYETAWDSDGDFGPFQTEDVRADHDRIRALEAENARLREALGETITYVEWVREGDSADGYGGSVNQTDKLLTRLRAVL